MTITATAPRAAAYRGRLRWWTELPLIAVVYALYSGARLLVRGDVDDAVEHGADILHFEQLTHLDPERWFNQLFTHHAFLGVPADFAYASLHYVVTPSILVWLWLRRPTHYRTARTWLLISTLIGLIGFTAVPTAPPRLLPGAHGFMDTMAQYGSYGWWGTDASAPRGMGHLTNQYAAMPSLHVGWSLWCGIMLFRYGRHWFVRTLGVLYPLTTALVVMGTANHYLMDAAAGVATMGIGFLLAKPALRVVDRIQVRVRGRFGTRPAAVAVTAGTPQPATAGTNGGGGKLPSPRPVSVPPGAPDDADRGPDAADGSGAGRGERSRMS
ncbi:phosphatase PAP2 family protein [Streptomyces sp. NBC_01198]|uniref:phosphatase PAP2 family protein n=1 Tax=Streptomyces sp. NBC_01198 TaxID=2903769 RepID=UPI002E1368E5|nr:phosphatase PAP2 family protein [Streptomyces sp. NBC_01198]